MIMKNDGPSPKVRLFWPGLWFSGMTHPAVPAISAFLKNNGIGTDIDDLNMGYISHTLSIKYIQNCAAKLKKELSKNHNLLKSASEGKSFTSELPFP